MEKGETKVACQICLKTFEGKISLVEHLRTDHEPLEIVSYAATTMTLEQNRDAISREFHRQFESIKRELAGG
jgi:hypothetical protein